MHSTSYNALQPKKGHKQPTQNRPDTALVCSGSINFVSRGIHSLFFRTDFEEIVSHRYNAKAVLSLVFWGSCWLVHPFELRDPTTQGIVPRQVVTLRISTYCVVLILPSATP